MASSAPIAPSPPRVQLRKLTTRVSLNRALFLIAALAILAIFAFLHIYRLGETPGWDPQEGYNLDIAWNLTHGQLRLFALRSGFAQHPPLFYLQLALAIRIFGYSIVAVRALAVFYALLTCATLLAFGRHVLGNIPALWAGVVYTIAPIILANTRWGYSYAQLAFVGLLCLWASWRYRETNDRRWLVVAATLAGLAAFSDYVGVASVCFVILLAWRRNGWRSAALSGAISVGVVSVGLLACFVAAPTVFFADLADTFGRAAGGNPFIQLILFLVNEYRFFSFDSWLLLGVIGLFLLPRRVRGFLLGAVAVLALITLKARAIGPSLHTIVPLLPLLALGAGLALYLAQQRLRAWTKDWIMDWITPNSTTSHSQSTSAVQERMSQVAATIAIFLVIISPIAIAVASDLSGVSTTLSTRQDAFVATPSDADGAITFILAHARAADLVLASPELAWRFDHPSDAPQVSSADLLQTIAQSGHSAAFYPADLSATHWANSVALSHARFVIEDNLLRQLASPSQVPALVPLLAQVERWPIVYQRGQYTIYEQPGSA